MNAIAAGVALGTVSGTDDPKGLGRVRVKYALSGGDIESDWVQVMSFFAGPGYGAFFLPKQGDTALLAFANGDPGQPYVLGFLWNGEQKPPVEAARQQEVRMIRTQLGKTIVLDDGEQGKLTISDEHNNLIELDTANNKISIVSEGDLEIRAKDKLTISAAQLVLQTADGGVKADLSSAGMQLQGAKALKLQATMIDLN